MKYLSIFLVLACVLAPVTVRAQTSPDYMSLGLGGYDFDKEQDRRKSVDYRAEYQWGFSLLPPIGNYFFNMKLHPTLGIEGNTKGALMGEGGLNFDTLLLHHILFTWGESIGAFVPGNDPRPLGSILEFRSQLELGWRFDNDLRVTAYLSHISNAHILNDDPGAEIAGMYLHIPMSGLNW